MDRTETRDSLLAEAIRDSDDLIVPQEDMEDVSERTS